jgi:hypothetical protein
MLSTFDWIRRCRSGAELLATLKFFTAKPDFSFDDQEIGAPLSALGGPCRRCYLYSQLSRHGQHFDYCRFCKAILAGARRLWLSSRKAAVVWGMVNQLPKQFQPGDDSRDKYFMGSYIHDQNRFLVMLRRRRLKAWLQELALYHGADLNGLIQIFPTIGAAGEIRMGEILCYAIRHEPAGPSARLYVQFYPSPYHVIKPVARNRQTMFTFEVSEFLSLLEMAEVFRALLLPHEQRALRELLNLNDPREEQFFWGRFLGQLNQEARDMLSAWRIRQWPKIRINLLYVLLDYAVLPDSR